MCSTPRSSGSVKKTRRLSTSSHIRSDIQMMRIASDMYERKLAERAKRRARITLEKESSTGKATAMGG